MKKIMFFVVSINFLYLQPSNNFINKNEQLTNNSINKNNQLINAIIDNDTFAVIDLLRDPKVQRNINYQDDGGSTALHYASILNRSGIIEELLYLGADPNIQDNSGATPLYVAVDNNATNAIRKLLFNKRCDIDIPNNYDQTPYQLAKINHNQTIINMFIDIQPDSEDEN